jgi:hypothetical protein
VTSRVLLRRAAIGATVSALAIGGTLIGFSAASAAPTRYATPERAMAPQHAPAPQNAVGLAHPAIPADPATHDAVHDTTPTHHAAPTHHATGAPDPALDARVGSWVARGGDKQLSTLGTDFTSLEKAARAADLNAMGSECRQLATDVKTAQAHAPIPDAYAQHNWSAALAQYAIGAKDCAAGATSSNVDLISQAADKMISGSNYLDKVTQRLTDIAGQ